MVYGPSGGYGPGIRQRAAQMAASRAPVVPTTNVGPRQRRGRPQTSAPNGSVTPQLPTGRPTPSVGPQAPPNLGAGAPTGGPYTGTAATGKTPQQSSPDDAAQAAFMSLLQGGPRDTSADEATIQKQMQANIGQNSADTMAGMAAGGFGMSGAAGAALGDVRTQAARSAAQQTMGVREQARQDYLKNVQTGLQAEMGDRNADMNEQQWADYIKILNAQTSADNAQQGAQDAVSSQDAGKAGTPSNNAGPYDSSPYLDQFGEPTNKHAVDPGLAAGAHDAIGNMAFPGSTYEGSDGTYDYYTSPFGDTVRVKRG